MSPQLINLSSQRAAEARLSKTIGKTGYTLLIAGALAFTGGAVALALTKHLNIGLFIASPALLCLLPAIWWKRQLSVLPPEGKELDGILSVDILARLKPGAELTPSSLFTALSDHWQSNFMHNHLLIHPQDTGPQMSNDPALLPAIFEGAAKMAAETDSPVIELGFVVASLLLTSPGVMQILKQIKSQPGDVEAVAHWLGREVNDNRAKKRNLAGGIGRDWAFGFTPLLDKFGHNVSMSINKNGTHFDWLAQSDGVKAIESAFNNHAQAVALIGPDGIGKTASISALAQSLILGNTTKVLAYHQVISLNATDITSNAQQQGDLEKIMLSLANEAAHAGHIILFFDDAQLFFTGGPGAFDGTQILLSIIQAKSVPMILAMSPSDYQRLRASNQSLANLLTPVVLQEQSETGVMHVLEDTALGLEAKHHIFVPYEALHEAYRLSGRYEQDEAYPGKAIKLLEQSVPHSQNGILNALSVQLSIEQTRGVKVTTATAAESDQLLNLEDQIHRRMINQSHAVKVVASALRRARAGVANPKRPIGSFLFLGPTGVGKTELAKAIAAIYFGNEANMLRLDMSEYQQPEDVARMLSDGQNESKSLIMSVREQPFSVVLLDEIEKAHPNILNLLLQLLDEGQLTDTSGRAVSFKDTIIITTSNAGAQSIREHVERGEQLEAFQSQFIDELINSGQYKPELLNRFDEIVLFRPLTPEELTQVVGLMMGEINRTLESQNISIGLTAPAIAKIVSTGYDPRLGARPMRRALQKAVEDTVAQKILKGEANPGDQILLDVTDLGI